MVYKGVELEEMPIYSSKFKNLSGTRIGEYYVICRGPNSKGGATRFWTECKCGKIELKLSTHLIRENTHMCVQCAAYESSKNSFKGVGEISYAYWKQLQRGAAGEKSKRQSRKIRKFEITIEEAWELFLKQNRRCALSGVPIQFITIGRGNKQLIKTKQTASLDRIDSTKDYTIDNVQWVHKDVNRMKNIFDEQYFIDMCINIANYRGE